MALFVQKFGGTSVGSPEKILGVARKILKLVECGNRVCVVVSAMGHTTDELLSLASKISASPDPREIDMLLTTGERISMALLSMALKDLGISAISLTGSQSGIITSPHHRRARILKIKADRVKESLNKGSVVIVAGFQGVSEFKEITTLGRGGSDTTAVALASVLKADRCDIFTDVDGVFSADPRIVKTAKRIPQLTSKQMVELALRGAGVLHPRSIEIAEKYNVPLWVKNSLSEQEHYGTEIVKVLNENIESSQVIAVTADKDKILLEIELTRPSLTAAIWDFATEHQLQCLLPDFQGKNIRFFVDKDSEEEWRKGLIHLTQNDFVKHFYFREDQIPVSLIGSRLTQDGKILSELSRLLEPLQLSLTVGQASSLAITFTVPKHHVDEVVNECHQKFIDLSH